MGPNLLLCRVLGVSVLPNYFYVQFTDEIDKYDNKNDQNGYSMKHYWKGRPTWSRAYWAYS